VGGQIDLDIVVSGLEEMALALRNFGRAAAELSAVMSARARVLGTRPPDTGHEPCPRLSALVSHDTHNWGPVGGVCPGA
jgi:hypothetical protein